MHAELRHFLVRLAGVVGFTLAPVVLTTLLTVPFSMGRDAPEAPTLAAARERQTGCCTPLPRPR